MVAQHCSSGKNSRASIDSVEHCLQLRVESSSELKAAQLSSKQLSSKQLIISKQLSLSPD
jgi:hypothetical protein